MNSQLMTQAEFAAHRGVQKSAVSNWKRQGLLIFAEGDGGKPMVDVERSDARLNRNLDPTRGRPTTAQMAGASEAPKPEPAAAAAPVDTGLQTVRTDLLRTQIVGKTLDNAKRAGELVLFAEFERLALDNGRVTRERMQALARTMAERLAAERDPRQITALLTEEIDKAFAELAEQIARSDAEDDQAAIEAIDLAEDAATAEPDQDAAGA